MNDLENTAAEVRGLEKAFLRRLTQSDASAAVIAEEVLEAAAGKHWEERHPVIRGYKAIELWQHVSVLDDQIATGMVYTETLTVLWNAVVSGWTKSKNPEDEHALARFIASTPRPAESKLGTVMIDKVRKEVNALEPGEATSKITRFLISADPDKDNEFMLKTLGQMLSRDLTIERQIFLARILQSSRMTKIDSQERLNIVASYFEENANRLSELANIARQMVVQAGLTTEPKIKLADLETIELLWEISAPQENAEAEQKFSDDYIAAAASKVKDWRERNPEAPAHAVTLVLRLESSFPVKGVRQTHDTLYDM